MLIQVLGEEVDCLKTVIHGNSFHHLSVRTENSLPACLLCIFMDDGSSRATEQAVVSPTWYVRAGLFSGPLDVNGHHPDEYALMVRN